MADDAGSPAEWLRYARSDLALASQPPPEEVLFSSLCFRAQQAAESAVTAGHVRERIPFPFTHNVAVLLGIVPPAVLIPDEVQTVGRLSTFAVAMRYPGSEEPPTQEAYDEAIRLAAATVAWATSLYAPPADSRGAA